MPNWWEQDKEVEDANWWQEDVVSEPATAVSERPLDPNEVYERAGKTWDLSGQYEVSLKEVEDNRMAFVAAEEPGFVKQIFEKYIREPITDATGLFPYVKEPVGGYDRSDRPFKTLAGAAAFGFAEYWSGRGLYVPDIVAKQIAKKVMPDKHLPPETLAELINEFTEFELTGKEKQIGEVVKAVGAFKTVGKLVAPVVAKIAARNALKIILGAGIIFGTRRAAEEVADKIKSGDPIDWKGIHFEGGIGVLFGAGEVAVMAVLTKLLPGMQQAYKTAITGEQRAAVHKDAISARNYYKKHGRMPDDLMKKYVYGPKGVDRKTVTVSVKGFGKYPIVKVMPKVKIVPETVVPAVKPTPEPPAVALVAKVAPIPTKVPPKAAEAVTEYPIRDFTEEQLQKMTTEELNRRLEKLDLDSEEYDTLAAKRQGIRDWTRPIPAAEAKPEVKEVKTPGFGFDIEKPKPSVKTKAVTRSGFVDLSPIVDAGPQIKSVSEKASKLVTRFGGLDSDVRKAFIEYEEQLRELPKVVAKDSIEKFGKLTPEQEDILQRHRENPKKYPDVPDELKATLDVLEKDIVEGGKRFEELGYTADWPNTYINRLEKKLQRELGKKIPAPDKIESLEAAIEEAKDLRYLHHFYEKESVGRRVINRFRRAVSKKPSGLIGRKIPTLEKAKELGFKPAPLAVSHSHFMHELARAEAASDLITAINSNPELSLPEDLAPEEWVKLDERIFPASVQHRTFVDREGKPVHIRKFRKYPITIAEALEEIAYTRNFSALEKAYDKLNFAMKIVGFYNPLIMTKNDAVQLWRAAGWKGAAPLVLPQVEFNPISINPPKAVQIFAEKGAEYEKLRKGGLFNNIVNYTPPVTDLSDLMLKHIRETSGEKAARIAKQWLNPTNFFKNLRIFNEATTWNMDEIMRIACYEAVKDTTMLEGMTDFEKIEWVNDAMVNYGKLPKETKRWLNKAIFTPSYRVGNFRYFWGQIAKHPWRMKGPLLRTVGYKMFVRWGLPAIIAAAILWKTDEERDVWTEKGYKIIITNPKTNAQTVYSLSDPLLEGMKISQRPIRQTLALNLAAVPALLVRLLGGPRFKQSKDPYGEFFKLGTPIYRDIVNWTDPDKTVPQKILTQFAVAFVYTRRAREEDKKSIVSALAKTLTIWTDWKEQVADLKQTISGRKYYLGPGGKFGRLMRQFDMEQSIDRTELDYKVDALLLAGKTNDAIRLMIESGRYESEEGISGRILKIRTPVLQYWQMWSKKERTEFITWLQENRKYSGQEIEELQKALDKSIQKLNIK